MPPSNNKRRGRDHFAMFHDHLKKALRVLDGEYVEFRSLTSNNKTLQINLLFALSSAITHPDWHKLDPALLHEFNTKFVFRYVKGQDKVVVSTRQRMGISSSDRAMPAKAPPADYVTNSSAEARRVAGLKLPDDRDLFESICRLIKHGVINYPFPFYHTVTQAHLHYLKLYGVELIEASDDMCKFHYLL